MRKPIQKLFTAFAVASALLLQSSLIAEAHTSFASPVILEERETTDPNSKRLSDNDSMVGLEKYPSAKKGGYTREQLEEKGFRFYTQKKMVMIQGDNGGAFIECFMAGESSNDNFGFTPEKLNRSIYLSGVKTVDNNLDGLVLLKADGTKMLSEGDNYYLGYVCNGHIAFPMITVTRIGDTIGLGIEEGSCSYWTRSTSWRKDMYRPLFEEMKKVFGSGIKDSKFSEDILNGEFDIKPFQNAFDFFMRSSRSISYNVWQKDRL